MLTVVQLNVVSATANSMILATARDIITVTDNTIASCVNFAL